MRIVSRIAACVAATLTVAPAAAQQGPSLGSLLADGYEVKAMTAADLQPGNGAAEENIFILVQKGTIAYGCALQTMTNSFCERIQ